MAYGMRLTREWLEERYLYESGILVTKRRCGGLRAGAPVLERHGGERVVRLRGVAVPVRAIVWRMHGGKWTDGVWRLNGKPLDDRIENLSDVKMEYKPPRLVKVTRLGAAKRYVVVRNMGVCDG